MYRLPESGKEFYLERHWQSAYRQAGGKTYINDFIVVMVFNQQSFVTDTFDKT